MKLATGPLNLLALASLSWSTLAQNAGYLAATFSGNSYSVSFQLAPASSPSTFRTLNGGQPKLVPTKGTKGARDPSLFAANNGKFYVFATDLNIDTTDWGTAQTNGSRAIFVWESSDGVNWSTDRLVTLMPPTAGYVWAPSAIWDPASSSYAMFWSSVVFAESDTAHAGTPSGPFIWYSHTTDFNSFTNPQRWDPSSTATVIDQEIQAIGGNSYVRYLSDTKEVQRVVVDRSDNGLFGTWTRIGVPVDAVREGPASYQDIRNPKRYYLWEDDYSGPGYSCWYTETFSVPYQACSPALTPSGMRHGSVIQVSSTVYNALDKT